MTRPRKNIDRELDRFIVLWLGKLQKSYSWTKRSSEGLKAVAKQLPCTYAAIVCLHSSFVGNKKFPLSRKKVCHRRGKRVRGRFVCATFVDEETHSEICRLCSWISGARGLNRVRTWLLNKYTILWQARVLEQMPFSSDNCLFAAENELIYLGAPSERFPECLGMPLLLKIHTPRCFSRDVL